MLNKILKLKYNFNPILHNRVILYFLVILALFDLIYFLNTNDIFSFFVLLLTGFLTSFFNKNMTVILFITIIITHIMKYGRSSYSEGMDNMENETIESNSNMDESKKDESKKDESKKDEAPTINSLTEKLKKYTEKMGSIVDNKDDAKSTKVIQELNEMKDTRDEILQNVKNMKPLLEKFQGYVEKFKNYKNETATNN
jgi:hypothetical protein